MRGYDAREIQIVRALLSTKRRVPGFSAHCAAVQVSSNIMHSGQRSSISSQPQAELE